MVHLIIGTLNCINNIPYCPDGTFRIWKGHCYYSWNLLKINDQYLKLQKIIKNI